MPYPGNLCQSGMVHRHARQDNDGARSLLIEPAEWIPQVALKLAETQRTVPTFEHNVGDLSHSQLCVSRFMLRAGGLIDLEPGNNVAHHLTRAGPLVGGTSRR